jgi:hypothetical protein
LLALLCLKFYVSEGNTEVSQGLQVSIEFLATLDLLMALKDLGRKVMILYARAVNYRQRKLFDFVCLIFIFEKSKVILAF